MKTVRMEVHSSKSVALAGLREGSQTNSIKTGLFVNQWAMKYIVVTVRGISES